MENILAIDLEDWHSLTERRMTGRFSSLSHHLDRQIDVLLNLLNFSHTKATFFVVGFLAEKRPDLVKLIASQGHEIASHGYIHLPINQMSPEDFKKDTKRSKDLLEDMVGKRVYGYRACEFSIVKKNLWALNILAELEFTYDSSIYPIRHRRYGIPEFSREITYYSLNDDREIIEFPLTTYHWGNINWPMAGGGYFRLIPEKILFQLIYKLQVDKMPLITYFHPYEFDPDSLNSFEVYKPNGYKDLMKGWKINAHQNIGRNSIIKKIKYIINKYKFTSFIGYLSRPQPQRIIKKPAPSIFP
jgi:polysaccharide deacetylase family protein (PEP-CTERM system associated)